MKRIKEIDNIIDSLSIENPKTWKIYSSKEQLKEFKKYLNLEPVINRERDTSEQKEFLRYEKVDSKLKEEFFKKIFDNWNYYCPYCWKSLIIHWNNWDNNKFRRLYDIEHFLPRSKYPHLSVNLYNWLPSCMACNQRVKRDKNPLDNITYKEWIFHPYLGFIIQNSNTNKKYKIISGWNIFNNLKYSFILNKNNNNILNSIHWKTFQLDKLYLESEDTYKIFNFIYKKQWLIIDEYFRFNNYKTVDEYIDYFFKEYFPEKEKELLKYDNWKFKYDLINDLKIELKELLEKKIKI